MTDSTSQMGWNQRIWKRPVTATGQGQIRYNLSGILKFWVPNPNFDICSPNLAKIDHFGPGWALEHTGGLRASSSGVGHPGNCSFWVSNPTFEAGNPETPPNVPQVVKNSPTQAKIPHVLLRGKESEQLLLRNTCENRLWILNQPCEGICNACKSFLRIACLAPLLVASTSITCTSH